MNRKIARLTLAICGMAMMAQATVIQYDMAIKGSIYNASSWIGNVLPGANDVVLIRNTANAESVTFSFTSDVSWAGIYIDAPVVKDLVVNLNGTAILSLGAEGIKTSTANIKTVTISVPVSLTADQTWSLLSGDSAKQTGTVNFNGYTLTTTGNNKKEIKQSLTGPGEMVLGGSGISFVDGVKADDVDMVLDMDSLTSDIVLYGWTAQPRVKSLAVASHSMFKMYNNTQWECKTNTVASAINLKDGFFTLHVEQTRNAKMIFSAPGLTREAGMTRFRGNGLGTTLISNSTTQSVNIVFDTPPTLVGDESGSGTTRPIIHAGVVDTTTGGYGMGFGTYDADYGVRVLDYATEYTNTITDGQSTLDNVRYNNEGSGQIVTTLTAPLTTINSLVMTEAGASNTCGIAIYAEPSSTLKINSGMIFASQSMPAYPSTNDAVILQVPNLDFNGKDAIVYIRETKWMSNGSSPAPFHFRSSPTNVSENGISFYAPQTVYVYLDGSQTNTFKGKFTINRGVYMRMIKTVPNNAILGPLVINGGSCQLNDQLADDVDVVMIDGSILIKTGASNSGNGGNETFRDLTMYDGTYTHGGGAGGTVIMRKVGLFGGMLNPTRSTRTTVSNDMVIATGGRLVISGNADSARSGPIVYVYGEMTISNTVATAQYNPIDMGYSWYRNAAALTLTNRLSVYGNSVNTNSVIVTRVYSSDPKTVLAEFRLSGPVEFAIDDGAAVNDFEVDASMANNGAAVGSLVKTGAGTLLLTAQTNSITGGFDINEGRLLLNGIVSNDVAVASGATFGGTGLVQVASGIALTVDAGGIVAPGVSGLGTLSVTGNVSLASTSVYQVDLNGNSSDALVVSGNVSGGAVLQVAKTGAGNGPWLILQANQITGTFTVQGENLIASTKAGGTELWLVKSQGTVISFQ